MKRAILAALISLSATGAIAQTNQIPREAIRPKSMEMDIALHAYLDATHLGLLAEESLRSYDAFVLGQDVEGLGRAGDRIVEVQVRHLNQEVRGLILVNVTTKMPMVVFPKKK